MPRDARNPSHRFARRRLLLSAVRWSGAAFAVACGARLIPGSAGTRTASRWTSLGSTAAYASPTEQAQPPSLVLPDWGVPQGGSFVAIVTGGGVTGVEATFAGRTAAGVPDG